LPIFAEVPKVKKNGKGFAQFKVCGCCGRNVGADLAGCASTQCWPDLGLIIGLCPSCKTTLAIEDPKNENNPAQLAGQPTKRKGAKI
jgi:hypothetical protein